MADDFGQEDDMGTYTYTLRTKTQNLELPGGEIVKAHIYGYLCRMNDHDTFMLYPGDYGYKRAMALNASIEQAQERFYGVGPVYIVTDFAEQGHGVYRAEDAEKAVVWYDCNCPSETKGVTKIGRLGPRVRRGRKLVWTVMTEAECQAFDRAEQERWEQEQAEQRQRQAEREAEQRRAAEAEARRRQAEEIAKEQAAEVEANYQARLDAIRAEMEAAKARTYNEAMIEAGYAPEEGGSR